MNCEKCKWFKVTDKAAGVIYGDCRKQCPNFVQIKNAISGESYGKTAWPEVKSDDFCGEFEPKQI
jgi:hypothetical protein